MRNWVVCVGYALLLAGFALAIPKLMEMKFLSIFTVENELGKGFQLNDAYYQFRTNRANPRAYDVVIVNTESLGSGVRGEFRALLHALTSACLHLEPTALGIDFQFAAQRADDTLMEEATALLKKQVLQEPRVILAHTLGNENGLLSDTSRWGVVNFPDEGRTAKRNQRLTFRDEQRSLPTFSAKLVEQHKPGWIEEQDIPEVFPLHYPPLNTSMERIVPEDSSAIPFRQTTGIPVLDAAHLLEYPTAYTHWIQNRIVIIGHVSEDAFDIEDKHRVPNDPVFFNRLPLVSGPTIHAIGVDNMLNYQADGWRYVPQWIQSASAFLLLTVLIYIVLYTGLGKAVNFALLAILSLPVLYLGFVLMNWGWYWPMPSTLLSFLFIYEIMKVIHPITLSIFAVLLQLKDRVWGAAPVLLVCLMLPLGGDALGQTIELMMMKGTALRQGVQYTTSGAAIFNLYPNEKVTFPQEAKVLITVNGASSVWTGQGVRTHGELYKFVQEGGPSLTSEFFRVMFVEGIHKPNSPNVGAAIRGGSSWHLVELNFQVIWTDSVWVGVQAPTDLAPPISWIVQDAEMNVEKGESRAGGGWLQLNSGQQYTYQLLTSGVELESGEFRTASQQEIATVDATAVYLRNHCSDCTDTDLESIRTALRNEVPY